MRRALTLLLVFTSLVLLCSALAPAYALTASPASKEFTYHQGKESYTLTVKNDETRPLVITFTPTGPLALLLEVPKSVTLASGESREFTIGLVMPDGTQPGVLESGVLIESKPVGAGTVSASSAILHIIRVKTPKDGAYVLGSLLSSAGVVGTPVSITLSLTNTGSVPINATSSVFLDGERHALPSVSLGPGETRDATFSWSPQRIGLYQASASVRYQDKEGLFTAPIVVGNLSITITAVEPGEFRLGDPFRVSVAVLNEWGDELPVTVTGRFVQDDTAISSTASEPRSVRPLTEERIPLFFESRGAVPGNATIEVAAHFADRAVVSTLPVIVSIDSLTERTAEVTSFWSTSTIVISALLLLLIVIIFIYRGRRLGSRGN